MTVRMGDVWDATADVLAERRGRLVPVALLAFLLPFSVRAAIIAWGGPSPGAAALVALAAAPLLLWGMMAVIALASDPAPAGGEAQSLAWRRLPAALLAALVVLAAAVAATLPVIGLLAATGFDFTAATAQTGGKPAMAGGVGLILILYVLVLAIVGIWLSARLFLLQAVIVLERRWLDAFGRSFALTRGLTWRLIGVSLLFAIVQGVAAFAARSVVFIVARLLLGGGQIALATWLGGVADALVTSAYIVVVGVFSARLYTAIVRVPA